MRRSHRRVDGRHQAQAADVGEEFVFFGEFAQAGPELLAAGGGVGHVLALRAGRSSPAPPGKRPGCRRRCWRGCRAASPYVSPCAMIAPSGIPLAIPFAQTDDVRLDAVMLDREHLPGAAHADLHLIDDEQDAVLVAQFPQAGRKPGGAG